MKALLRSMPFASRMVLALALGTAAIIAGGLIYNHSPIKPYFPFAGEVLLMAAMVLLYRTDKDRARLLPLGLKPSLRTGGLLLLGLFIGMAAVLATAWLRTVYTGEQWHFNGAASGQALLKSLYYMLPTIMVQELMFRGYAFTKTASRFGLVKANVLFAIIFMLVHVLDRAVLQSLPRITSLAICIPIGHLWFATGLVRTRTLRFPIGLHWGNNWAVQHLTQFSKNEGALFYLSHQQVYNTWVPFVILLLIFNGFFVLLTWATWRWQAPLWGRGQKSTG